MNFKIVLSTFLLWAALAVAAQAQGKIAITERDYNNAEVEMADTFRAEGKIYVVVGVVSLVLAGMAAYLFMLDRRVGRIEQTAKEHKG